MKKIFAAVITAALVAGAAAPAFAEATLQNCVFKDKALCTVETLSNTKED